MDLLYKRYADPFSFLSKILIKYKLSESIVKIWNKEQEDTIFRMYLHSFSDKPYSEYKKELLNSNKENIDKEETQRMTEVQKIEIVKKSNDILKNFTPIMKKKEDNTNGTF